MTVVECVARVRHRYLRPADDVRLAIMVCGKVIAWGECARGERAAATKCEEGCYG